MPNHDRFECQTAIDSDAILHLAGFQDIADAVLKPGAIPVQLIFERLLKENLLQLFDGLVTEKNSFSVCAARLCCG